MFKFISVPKVKEPDPLLWFPTNDSSDDEQSLLTPPTSIINEATSSTPYNQPPLFSDDDLFSASQTGSLFSTNNPEYVPSLGGQSSRLSDYFSEEEKVDDSLMLVCQLHGITFDDSDSFENHQISEHTVKGRISCGLCKKSYSTKYLWRNHFKGAHLGEKFECSVQNCSRKFSQKRYRDEHVKTHSSGKASVCYVCEICDITCDSLENLKRHKLNHSTSKKFICRICKIHGYTRTNDRLLHEEECGPKFNVMVNDDGEVVPLTQTVNPPQTQTTGNQKAKKRLFDGSSKKPSKKEKSLSLENSSMTSIDDFPIENGSQKNRGAQSKSRQMQNVSDDQASVRSHLPRDCKKGISYKNGCSPRPCKNNSSDSSNGTAVMKSPKASIKGKWKCTFCKQYFKLREQLLEHVETFHKNKNKNGFKCSRCYVPFDLEQEYHIHMHQHNLDDKKELREINRKRKR